MVTRLPAGESSISMPCSSSSSPSVATSRPFPPGKSVATTSEKCCSTAAYVSSKRFSTVSVRSPRSLSSSASEFSRSSRSPVSSRSRSVSRACSSAASGLTCPSCSRRAASRETCDAQRVALLVGERLALGVLGEPRGDLLALALEPRRLDLHLREPLGRVGRLTAEIRLAGAQLAEPFAGLARAASTRVDAGSQRRLEPSRRLGGALEQHRHLLGRLGERLQRDRAHRRALGLGTRREPRLAAGGDQHGVALLLPRRLYERRACERVVDRCGLPAARGLHDLVVRRRRLRERHPGTGEIGAKRARGLGGALTAQVGALDRATQPVERSGGALVPPARLAELFLGLAALLEEPAQLLVARTPVGLGGGAALGDTGEQLVDSFQIGGGKARLELRDLVAQLLGALGGGGLQREGTDALAHLGLEVAGAVDLVGDACELQLGAVALALEAAEPGGLFDERAAVGGLRREDLLDAALADDGVHLAADAHVREQLDEVGAAHRRAVHDVASFAAAGKPPRDRDLLVRERPFAARVVEEELDGAGVRRRAPGRPGEEDVLGLLGAQLGRAQAAGGPADRVGDVRFPGAVRPHDDGHARLEEHLDRIRKRLEAAQLDRPQEHAREVSQRRSAIPRREEEASRGPRGRRSARRPSSRRRSRSPRACRR